MCSIAVDKDSFANSLSLAPPDSAVITGPSSVAEGQAFQLSCSANGWPPPSIQVKHVHPKLILRSIM